MSPLRSPWRATHANPLDQRRNSRVPLASPVLGVVYGEGSEEATIPDIVPPALASSDGAEPRSTFDRISDTGKPAYAGWPELRVAGAERGSERIAVVLHRVRAELGEERARAAALPIETLLARRIRHTNVLPVLDIVQMDGEPELVMDWISGETLANLRRARPVPLPIAIAVVCDALAALDAGHRSISTLGRSLHLTHGCLSPGDLLVGADGVTRLVDFGLADDAGRALTSGFGSDAHGYVAPEQVFDRQTDQRSDVFLAAVVLWECLTGRALLAGSSPVERLLKFMTIGADPPSLLNAAIPPELDAVLARALEPSPERRQQSAAELEAALTSAASRATRVEVSRYVQSMARVELEAQAARRRELCEAPDASRTRSTFAPRARSQRPHETIVPESAPEALKHLPASLEPPRTPSVPGSTVRASELRERSPRPPREKAPSGPGERAASVPVKEARRAERARERTRLRALRRRHQNVALFLSFVALATASFLVTRSLSEGRLRGLVERTAAWFSAENSETKGTAHTAPPPLTAGAPPAALGQKVPVVRAEELPLSDPQARGTKPARLAPPAKAAE